MYYSCDGAETCAIPKGAIRGRVGTAASNLSGYIDLKKGKIRLDCMNNLEFWVEVDMSSVPCLAHAPDGPAFHDTAQHFERAQAQQAEQPN